MVVALFWIIGSLVVALYGASRKFGFWGYFMISMFLSPLVGLLIVFASDPRPRPERYSNR